MKILHLTLEKDIELEKKHEIMYLNYKDKVNGEFPESVWEKIRLFKPDMVFEREFNDGVSRYPDVLTFVRDNFPMCKRCVWLIDSHCNLEWHLYYSQFFQYIFLAISKFKPIFANYFKKNGMSDKKIFWLPLCYPRKTTDIKRNKSKVPYDIVFVGRWNGFFGERTRLLQRLNERYKERIFMITDYANMEDYIRQGIISFNCSLSDDMNFRVFETLANGIELVTNDVPDLHLIQGLEGRINIYKNDEELFQIIDNILDCKIEHDVIRTQIWIQNHHCLVHRMKDMISMTNTNYQLSF